MHVFAVFKNTSGINGNKKICAPHSQITASWELIFDVFFSSEKMPLKTGKDNLAYNTAVMLTLALRMMHTKKILLLMLCCLRSSLVSINYCTRNLLWAENVYLIIIGRCPPSLQRSILGSDGGCCVTVTWLSSLLCTNCSVYSEFSVCCLKLNIHFHFSSPAFVLFSLMPLCFWLFFFFKNYLFSSQD